MGRASRHAIPGERGCLTMPSATRCAGFGLHPIPAVTIAARLVAGAGCACLLACSSGPPSRGDDGRALLEAYAGANRPLVRQPDSGRGASVSVIRNGRIARFSDYYDAASFFAAVKPPVQR